MPILSSALAASGYSLDRIDLPEVLRQAVAAQAWPEVDRIMRDLTAPGGMVYQHLQAYHTFSHIEHILSIRDSRDPDQEDGIWHDDGSRYMAVTLSLTLEASQLGGGMLGIRHKETRAGVSLPTPLWGEMIVYLTGHYGYEHKIHQVTAGCRVVVACWCSDGRNLVDGL